MAPNMQESSVLLLCPSFNSYNSIRFAEIAHKVSQEFSDEIEDFGLDSSDLSSSEQEEEEEVTETAKINKNSNEDDEFEFPFCRDHESLIISTADEIFSNGQIRPVFPIFNQNLLAEDLKPQNDTLEHFPAATTSYCILTQKQQPSPDQRCKKSNSTGTSKLWKPRDNLITRSNSDGKEDIVFLASSTNCCSNKKKDEKKSDVLMMKRRSGGDRNVDQKLKTTMNKGSVVKSAHEIHYVQNRALREVDRRRTFLPYRKDLIGFFANVNGLTKQIHPF